MSAQNKQPHENSIFDAQRNNLPYKNMLQVNI